MIYYVALPFSPVEDGLAARRSNGMPRRGCCHAQRVGHW